MSSDRVSRADSAGTNRCVEIARNFLQSIGAASRSTTATASSRAQRNSPRFYSDGVWEVVREARRHGAVAAAAATRDAVQTLISFTSNVDPLAQCSVRTAAARAVVALASGSQLGFRDAVDTLAILSRSAVLQELEAGVTGTCEVLFLKVFTVASSESSSSNGRVFDDGRIHPLIAIIRAHAGQQAAQVRILTRIFQSQTAFLSDIASQHRAALTAGQASTVKVRERVIEKLVAQNQPFFEFLLFNQTVPTKLRELGVSLLRRIVVECVLPSAAAVVAPLSTPTYSSGSWHGHFLGRYAIAVARLLTWYAQFVGVACKSYQLPNSGLDSSSALGRQTAVVAEQKFVDGIQWSTEELAACRCLTNIGAISEQHGHCLRALDAVFACMGLEISVSAASRAITFAELGSDIAVLLLRLWRESDAINDFLNNCHAQKSDSLEADHPFLRDSNQENIFEGLRAATADHKMRMIAQLRTLVTSGGYATLAKQRCGLGDAFLHQLCDIVRFEQSAIHRNVAQNILVEVTAELVGRSDRTASFSALVHVLVALIACPSANDNLFRCTPHIPGCDLVARGDLPWQTDLQATPPSSSLALRLLKVIQETAAETSPLQHPLVPSATLDALLKNGNIAAVLPRLLALGNQSILCGLNSFDFDSARETETSSSSPVMAAYYAAISDMVGNSGACTFGVPRTRSLPVLICALALFHPHLAANGKQRAQEGLMHTLSQSVDAGGQGSTSASLIERIVRQTVNSQPSAALELLPCLQFAAQFSIVGLPTATAGNNRPPLANSPSFAHYMSILDAATALVANPRCTKAALCFLARPMMLARSGSQEATRSAAALALAGRLLCRTLVANSATVGLLSEFIHDCGLGQMPTQIPADILAVQLHSLIQLCDHGGRQVGADFVKFVGNALVEAKRAQFQGERWASQATALCILSLQRLCRDGHINFATGLRIVRQHFPADSELTSSTRCPLTYLIHLALAQFYSEIAEALCTERLELLAELEECGVHVEEVVAAGMENSTLADAEVGSAVKQLSETAEQINGIVAESWNFIAKLPSDFIGVGGDLERATCAWWNCLRVIATLPVARAGKDGDPVVNVVGSVASVASASSDTGRRMRLVESRGFASESPLVRNAVSMLLTTVCSHDAATQSYMRRWSSHTHQLVASEPDSPTERPARHHKSAKGRPLTLLEDEPSSRSWQEHLMALLCGHGDGVQNPSPVATLPGSSNSLLASYASCAPEERAAMSLRVVCLYGHEVHSLGAALRADILEFGKSFWDLFPQLCADVEPPVRRLALRNGELANPDFWLGQATFLPAWRLFCARWLLAEVQIISCVEDFEGHGDSKFVDQEKLLKQAGKTIWNRALKPALERCLASSRPGNTTSAAKAMHNKAAHPGAGRSRSPGGAKPGSEASSPSVYLPEEFPKVANIILAAAALHSLLPRSYCASVKTAILRLLSQVLAQDAAFVWKGGHTVVAAAAEALGFLARVIVGEASALGSSGDSGMASTTSAILGLSKGILTKWQQHAVNVEESVTQASFRSTDAARPFLAEKNQLICFLLTSALGQCAAACLQWSVVLRSRHSRFEPAHKHLVQTIIGCIANATRSHVAVHDTADACVTATAHGAHVAVRWACNAVQLLLASETFGPTIEACVHSANDTLEVFDCVKVLVSAFSRHVIPSDGSNTDDPLSAAWFVTCASVFSVAEQLQTTINRATSAQAESTPRWGVDLNPNASQRILKARIKTMSAQARRLLADCVSTPESITSLFLLSSFAFFSHGVSENNGAEGPVVTGAVRRELIQLISATGAARATTSSLSERDKNGSTTNPRCLLARVVGALLASMTMHAGTHLLASPLDAAVTLSDETWLCRWLARSGTWGLLQSLSTACDACLSKDASAVEAGSDPIFQVGVLIHGSVLSAASIFYSEVGASSPGLHLLPQLANPFSLVPRDKAAKYDPAEKGIHADVAKVANSRMISSRSAQREAPTMHAIALPSGFSLTILKSFPQGSMLRFIAKSLMSAIQELADAFGQPLEGDEATRHQHPSSQQTVVLIGTKIAALCGILADSTLPIIRLQLVAASVLSAASQFMKQMPGTKQFEATAAALTESCLRLIIVYSYREGSLSRLLTTSAILKPCCLLDGATPPPAAVSSLRVFIAANFAKILRCAAPQLRGALLVTAFAAFVTQSVSLSDMLLPNGAASGSRVEIARLFCQQLAQFASSSSTADPMPRRLFQKSFFLDTWVPWLLRAKEAAPFEATESVVAHFVTCAQAGEQAGEQAGGQSLVAVSALAVVPPTWIHVFVFERSASTRPTVPIADAVEAMWFSYCFHRSSSPVSVNPGGVCDREVLLKFLHDESVTAFLVKRPSTAARENVVDGSLARTIGYYASLACRVIGTNNTVTLLELIYVFAKSFGTIEHPHTAEDQVPGEKLWAGDRVLQCLGALLVAWSSQQRHDILANCSITIAASQCIGSEIIECYRHLLRHAKLESATGVLQQLQGAFLQAWERIEATVAEGEGPSADQTSTVRQLVVLTFEALPSSMQAVWWDRVSPALTLV